jgi:hypothetical protein
MNPVQMIGQTTSGVKAPSAEAMAKGNAAEAFNAGIPCGPLKHSCDLGYHCPNHGGSCRSGDDEFCTVVCQRASERYNAAIARIAGKIIPLVAPRTLTSDQLDDVKISIFRSTRKTATSYDPIRDELSINDMAAVAIGLAMVDELGEVFEIPESQYLVLFWEYVETLQMWGRK